MQMLQKFDVEIPLVRLITQPPTEKQVRTAPLPQAQTPFTPASISAPLSPAFEPFVPLHPAQQPFALPLVENVISPIPAANDTASALQAPVSGVQTSPLLPTSVVLKKQKISLVGQSLGRYQIESLLGEGPSGDVYQVYDRLRENRVALKAIQTNMAPSFAGTLAMEEEHVFQREATLMARLKHSHIVPVLNTGKTYVSGSSFMYKTMPFYAEGSLMQWLYGYGGHKNYAPHEVLPLIMQLADALQYAHDQQELFLNFKPGNILVKEAAKSIDKAELVLTDFALEQDGGPYAYSPDTFPYIAPERWEGYAQPASDQYALAVLAYELLSGRALFQGTTEQIMRRLHLTMQAQPPSLFNRALSVQASGVILRALAKKPEERFASIGLFAQNLQRFCS
jgi:serine/threonine protein kinase